MTELRMCVIGGSNSRMKNGYVPPLVEALEARTGRAVTLQNLVIGGTFSHYGLWQLLTDDPYRTADIVVVEYAFNDAELFFWGMSQDWARAYEGLLRKLRAEAPQAQIVCPLLYSRTSALRGQLAPAAAFVAYINQRYGVATIDVNARIATECDAGSEAAMRAWYKDQSHYTRDIQARIARHSASSVSSIPGN